MPLVTFPKPGRFQFTLLEGETPVVGVEASLITIRVRPLGRAEYAEAVFPYATWCRMAPISRTLAIHEQCRDVLQGQRFEVMGETLA